MGADGDARIWDVATGSQLGALSDPKNGPITDAAFSPDGRLIATAENGGIGLWNAQTHRRIRFASTPGIGLVRIAFDPSGERIVAVGDDGTARLFGASLNSTGVISEPGGRQHHERRVQSRWQPTS